MIKLIDIDKLQPTQTRVVLRTVAKLNNKPLSNKVHAEVWSINGVTYIADGHHEVFNRHLRKQTKVPVLYYSPENCGLGPGGYEFLVEEILNKGKEAANAGIKHVGDMEFKHKEIPLVQV